LFVITFLFLASWLLAVPGENPINKLIFGPSREETWRQLSAAIGADYVAGGFWKGDKVVARHGQWTITLDTYTESTGDTSYTYTRMRCPTESTTDAQPDTDRCPRPQ
jgi:hypothetical protein